MKNVFLRGIIILLSHLPFMVNGQGLDVEFFLEPDTLTFKITNISNYEILIWFAAGCGGDGKSEVRIDQVVSKFDRVVYKKDTIRDIFCGLYPEELEYALFLSPHKTYTKSYAINRNPNVEYIKAKVFLRYIIKSTPRKSMFMDVVFNIKEYEL